MVSLPDSWLVFRNKGYNWLPYHLDGIFGENWLDSSYLT